MIVYLDSSVLLRVLLNQPNKLNEFTQIKRAVSSILLKAECLRSLDRMRILGKITEENHLKSIETLYETLFYIEFIEISDRILERTGSAFSVALGTLDAIHLSSALLWVEEMKSPLIFLTHDLFLAKACRSHGVKVLGC